MCKAYCGASHLRTPQNATEIWGSTSLRIIVRSRVNGDNCKRANYSLVKVGKANLVLLVGRHAKAAAPPQLREEHRLALGAALTSLTVRVSLIPSQYRQYMPLMQVTNILVPVPLKPRLYGGTQCETYGANCTTPTLRAGIVALETPFDMIRTVDYNS